MPPSDRSAGAARPRRLGSKLALGMGATFVGLLLAELILQLAGVVVSRTYDRGAGSSGDADAITILCVGDSHTFGLPLPEEEAYPAQLEVALEEAYPERHFRVVNLGIPCLNSTFVANRLERQIFQLRRDLTRMVELTRSVDTPILLVAYPMGGQQAISRVIIRTAGRLGVGVIETKHDLERARAAGHGRSELIDHRSGPHPSGLLYRYVVESMRPVVAATLSTWHGISLEATP
jgi:hypothetical protein